MLDEVAVPRQGSLLTQHWSQLKVVINHGLINKIDHCPAIILTDLGYFQRG